MPLNWHAPKEERNFLLKLMQFEYLYIGLKTHQIIIISLTTQEEQRKQNAIMLTETELNGSNMECSFLFFKKNYMHKFIKKTT